MPEYSDDLLRGVFTRVRTVTVVGFSANPARPSHYVAAYLAGLGYRIVPVNPGLAGQSFLGATVVASLAEVKEPIDMVDIFRRPVEVPGIVDDALQHLPGLGVIWMQLGIAHAEAAAKVEAAGKTVIQDRCPKIEYPRLFGSMARSEII